MQSLAQSKLIPLFQAPPRARHIVVIEAGDAGPLLRRIAARPGRPIDIVRVVDVSNGQVNEGIASLLEPKVLKQDRIWAIVLSAGAVPRLPLNLLLRCRLDGVRLLTEANFWEEEASWIDVDSQDPGWLLGGNGFKSGWGTELATRNLDLLTATALLILTLPVMLIVALLIKLDSRGPVFYRQERVGLGGKVFMLNKFRSMSCDAEVEGPRWAQISDPRVTRVGRIIRLTRIDELPQLLNVLHGEMCMVGPRPERPYFVEQLSASLPFYAQRHYVKPGITGWAQVNAPYTASIEDTREKLQYDLYYIKYRNVGLYLRVLLQTIRVVVCGKGAR